MGGTTEPIINALKESYSENAELAEAVRIAVDALRTGIASTAGNATPAAEPRVLGPSTLEVAILDVNRPRRAFRRITGAALETVLPTLPGSDSEPASTESGDSDGRQA
jgi:proteasome alpha subunit